MIYQNRNYRYSLMFLTLLAVFDYFPAILTDVVGEIKYG